MQQENEKNFKNLYDHLFFAGRYKKIQYLGGKVYILNPGKQVNRILMLSGIQKYVIFMKD